MSDSQSDAAAAASEKKRVGRKLAHTTPASRHQELNRLNGRKFRERQKQQLSSLEKQVAEFHDLTQSLRLSLSLLQRENNGLKDIIQSLQQSNALLLAKQAEQQSIVSQRPNECINCANEARKAHMYQQDNLALQARLETQTRQFELERFQLNQAGTLNLTNGLEMLGMVSPPPAPLRANSSQTPMFKLEGALMKPNDGASLSTGTLSDEWSDVFGNENGVKSAEQVHGPMKVEFARYSLNMFPILKGHHFLNVLLDPLVAASRTTDRVKLRKLLTRSIGAQHKILELSLHLCNKTDHDAIFDTLHTLRSFNAPHYDYMLDLVSDKDGMQRLLLTPCDIRPVIRKTQQALKAVPSLADAHQVIDEYAIIASQPKLTPELFMELRNRLGKIERWCLPETEDAKRVAQIWINHRRENNEYIVNRLEEATRGLDLS
ncbi:hypothetical protein HDU81_008523 [Chytriomyces hyalinus]|nr:hypothetical protein HDU81_008523 [Chytriomyces hyalinus]